MRLARAALGASEIDRKPENRVGSHGLTSMGDILNSRALRALGALEMQQLTDNPKIESRAHSGWLCSVTPKDGPHHLGIYMYTEWQFNRLSIPTRAHAHQLG